MKIGKGREKESKRKKGSQEKKRREGGKEERKERGSFSAKAFYSRELHVSLP